MHWYEITTNEDLFYNYYKNKPSVKKLNNNKLAMKHYCKIKIRHLHFVVVFFGESQDLEQDSDFSSSFDSVERGTVGREDCRKPLIRELIAFVWKIFKYWNKEAKNLSRNKNIEKEVKSKNVESVKLLKKIEFSRKNI